MTKKVSKAVDMEEVGMEATTENAFGAHIQAVEDALKKDEELAYGWHANAAMGCCDLLKRAGLDYSSAHNLGNALASDIMLKFFNVKTDKHMMAKAPVATDPLPKITTEANQQGVPIDVSSLNGANEEIESLKRDRQELLNQRTYYRNLLARITQ